MVRHLPYRLGLIIPCVLISFIGYGTWFYSLGPAEQNTRAIWLAGYAMVWSSYLQAIWTSPGTTRKKNIAKMEVWCEKCQKPKPERAHHCKQCGVCVLSMDHHCPWTNNCVGHNNLPHFLRFLSWVVVETSYAFYLQILYVSYVWGLPSYLLSKKELAFLIVNLLVTFFVIFTVGLLWIRVMYNLLNGQTQIESWEQERANTMARRKLAPRVEFPFDIDFYTNFYNGVGPWYLAWCPFAHAPGDGYTFPKLFDTNKRWPPENQIRERRYEFYRPQRYISSEGEDLEFFGVDPEVDNEYARDDDDIPLSELKK